MDSKLWGSYTSDELKEYITLNNPVVVLPVASYEQHGPHLPIDTDTDLGWSISLKAIEKTSYPCLLLPAVWSGVAAHHMGFCGTISLNSATFISLIREIVLSIRKHGVIKILILNSHGGNHASLSVLADEINYSNDAEVALVTYWNLIADVVSEHRQSTESGICHGCEMETSLTLFLRPDDVRKNKLEANNLLGSSYCGNDMFGAYSVNFARSFHLITKLGHIGDPTKGNRAFGEIVFESVTEELSKVINIFGEGKLY